jgi:hypothetical protein
VPDLIEGNAIRYGGERRQFRTIDATHDPLPHADAALCREVLFHLSFEDIWSLVENVRRSGTSFFIATTDRLLDRFIGAVRHVDHHAQPVHLVDYFAAPGVDPVPARSRTAGIRELVGVVVGHQHG